MFFMYSTQTRGKGNERGRGKDNKTCPSDSGLLVGTPESHTSFESPLNA